jgi:acetolactate synthase regulatory subunit
MSGTFCFSVHAEASPSTLPRVVEVFALHGHVPCRCHAQLAGPGELVVDLQMADVTAHEAALLAKRLGRVVTVRNVLWSEKRAVVAA